MVRDVGARDKTEKEQRKILDAPGRKVPLFSDKYFVYNRNGG